MARHVDVVRRIAHGDWAPPDLTDDEWESLRAYAATHHVAHYLLGRVVAQDKQALFPAGLLDGLRAEVERGRERVALLRAALPEAVDALAASGLDCLVLKGTPFGMRYHGDADLRRSLDIDLLVRFDDADAALRALAARGFEPQPRRTTGAGDRLRVRRKCLRTQHALSLERGEVHIDLHWRLRTAPAYRLDEDRVWGGIRSIPVDGRGYPALSDEYALVMLLLSIAHDIGRRSCRLKHVLDAYLVLRRVGDSLDWQALLERRRPENTLAVVVNALDLVRTVFAAPGEFPALTAALERHAELRAAGSTDDALLLVHGLAGARAHVRWFTGIYPVSFPRDLLWVIDRKVVGLRSLPLLLLRPVKAGYWALRNRAAQRRARRG